MNWRLSLRNRDVSSIDGMTKAIQLFGGKSTERLTLPRHNPSTIVSSNLRHMWWGQASKLHAPHPARNVGSRTRLTGQTANSIHKARLWHPRTQGSPRTKIGRAHV